MFEKSCARVDLMEAASYPFIRHTSQTRERLNDADNSLYTSRKRYLKGKGKCSPSECSSCRPTPLCAQRTPFPSTPPYTTLTIKLRNYFSQGRLNALFRFLHGCELSYNDSPFLFPPSFVTSLSTSLIRLLYFWISSYPSSTPKTRIR